MWAKTSTNTSDIPDDAYPSNQAIQFEWTGDTGTYDIPTYTWAATDLYVLTVHASPQSWNVAPRSVHRHELRQQDNTVLWSASSLMPPTTDNFGRNPWTEAQTFTYTISAGDFTTGTEGELLRFKIEHQWPARHLYR